MNFLKYPGGKNSELPIINKYIPKKIKRYYEPFVGGGAVYFNTLSSKYFINDKSTDLINLYTSVKKQDEIFFKALNSIENSWKKLNTLSTKHFNTFKKIHSFYIDEILDVNDIEYMTRGFVDKIADSLLKCIENEFYIEKSILINECKKYLFRKIKDLKKINAKTKISETDLTDWFEGILKGSFYMYLRNLYNQSIHDEKLFKNGQKAALYLFIRETTYSSMFRFNDDGDFNVPYGGITYNNKNFTDKINLYKDENIVNKLSKTTIKSFDFYDFMSKYPPQKDDFVFVDPPYDSEFSTYDKSKFEQNDQKRLADYLINECEGNFMIVIKNTEFISSLYPIGINTKNGGKINVIGFDKKYSVSFMNRNDKKCEHLIITNYEMEE